MPYTNTLFLAGLRSLAECRELARKLFDSTHYGTTDCIGTGTIFRLGEQKLVVKKNQNNQIQNITLSSIYFSKKVYTVYNGV